MFLYDPNETQLYQDQKNIINALILHSANNYDIVNNFFISYSDIEKNAFLTCFDPKTLYYCFNDHVLEKTINLSIKDPSDYSKELFKTTLLDKFNLGGVLVNKQLSYKYSLEKNLFKLLSDESIRALIIERLSPVPDTSSQRILFIESLEEKERSILLSLIQTHYLDYYDAKFRLFKNEYSIYFDAFNILTDDISQKDLKACMNKFSRNDFWIYRSPERIPMKTNLITKWFFYEYNERPFLSYEYSNEMCHLLRDHDFINDFLIPKYDIDPCGFQTLQEIEGIDF
jgi:hypothetical protein